MKGKIMKRNILKLLKFVALMMIICQPSIVRGSRARRIRRTPAEQARAIAEQDSATKIKQLEATLKSLEAEKSTLQKAFEKERDELKTQLFEAKATIVMERKVLSQTRSTLQYAMNALREIAEERKHVDTTTPDLGKEIDGIIELLAKQRKGFEQEQRRVFTTRLNKERRVKLL